MSLTQREFLFLDDLIHQEELEVKCHLDWAQRAQDQTVKQLFFSLARQHQQHYDRLVNFLGQAVQGQYGLQGQQAQAGTSFQAQGGFGQGSFGTYGGSTSAGYVAGSTSTTGSYAAGALQSRVSEGNPS